MRVLTTDYVAGLFDGEGSVGVYPSNGGTSWSLRLAISNQYREVLDQIAKDWGGSVNNKDARRILPVWAWQIADASSERFVFHMYERCVIKKDQLRIAKDYLFTIPEVYYRGSWNPMPDEVRTKREHYAHQLRALKPSQLAMEVS